jgi:hypothetical protein
MTHTTISPWKSKIVAGLEGSCSFAYNDAILDGEWKTISKATVPSAAFEMYCLKKIRPQASIEFLKKIKQHLIRLNLTVLTAYENHRLFDAVEAVEYREAHFKPKPNRQPPESSEPGWEDRMEKAMASINELREANKDA